MRKIIFILIFSLLGVKGFSQFAFPSTDSLHRYTNRFVTNSAINAFTDYRLNTLIHGIINWIDSARLGTGGTVGVDTIYALNDSTIRYRKNSVNYTFNLRGRYWTLQQVLTNGSTLTTNPTVTLADSITFTSGKFRINDTLKLSAIIKKTDTTTYKPVVIDAAGNVFELDRWPGASTLANAGGAGDTLLTSSNTIKRLQNDYGITFSTNANKILIFADTLSSNSLVTKHMLNLTKQTLTDASTTTWDITNGKAAEWTIGGNRTLSITNAGSTPWQGLVKIIQGSGGNYVPLLPGHYHDVVWRLNIGDTNQLYVYFDGSNYHWSSAFSMNTSTGGQLEAPENFSVIPLSTTSNSIVWDAVPNATSYQLQRSTAINFRTALNTIYTGANTFFTETGLSAGTQYYYRVKALAAGYQTSRHAYTEPLLATTMQMKIQPQAGTLILEGSESWEIGAVSGEGAVLEPSLLAEGDTLKMFYTGSAGDQDHHIGMAYTTTSTGAFTKLAGNPLIGDGLGGASAGRLASSSCVIKVGSTLYCWALDGYGFPGDTRQVYQYKSVNGGHTWTSVGLAFATGGIITGYGNTTIWPEPIGGTYYGVVDIMTAANIWETVKVTATNIEGPWTVSTTKLTDMQPVAGGMYGGGYLHRTADGTWHYLYHYGVQAGNLPTSLAYARSTDNLDNWTIVETDFLTYFSNDDTPPTPPASANSPYPVTDQIADIYLCEYKGKVHIVAEYGDNSMSSGNVLFQIRRWTYEGTIEQFFNVLPTFVP